MKKGPGSLAILLGGKPDKEPEDTEETKENSSDDDLLGLSEDFLSAVKDGDAEALAETLSALKSSFGGKKGCSCKD